MCQQGRWLQKGLRGPTLIGEGNKCQRGCWAPKGGGLRDLTLVGEFRGGLEVSRPLEKGTSASEDAEPQRGWIVRSHLGWGASKGVDCEIPPRLGRRTKHSL